MACVTAVDENIGQVLSAVNKTKLKNNTIVIIASDHGWTMGEKEHVYKNSLWKKAQGPLIIRAPGYQNQIKKLIIQSL